MIPDPTSAGMRRSWREFALWPVLAFLAIGTVWALLELQWGRALAWDEVEFVRATEWVRQGRVPFRDFWEHHAPLTWFLMAPWKHFAQGPGVQTVLTMRWGQVPLWTGAFWALHAWMKDAEVAPWLRWWALAALLACPLFVLWGLEYRVDVLGAMCILLALLGQLRFQHSRGWSLVAGAALAGAILANLRFGPLAVAALLLMALVDCKGRAWRWQPAVLWVTAGFLSVLVVTLLYMVATHSVSDWWRSLILDNARTDSLAGDAGKAFWRILGLPFSNLDLPGMILLLGGAAGTILSLREIRRPGPFQVLALVHLANLLFILRMKATYAYHFQLVLLLSAPLMALAGARWLAGNPRPWRLYALALGILAVQSVINGRDFAGHRQTQSLAYQDFIMKEVDADTRPGDQVLDGCGYALRREPAYRHWFLAFNVRSLSLSGLMDRYPLEELRQHPPAAVIANLRLSNWLFEWPDLGHQVVSHYLPIWPNLWLPGMSSRLDARTPRADWVVPRTGAYRLAGSSELSRHPWFVMPLALGQRGIEQGPGVELEVSKLPPPPADRIDWSLNGSALKAAGDTVQLRQGDHLSATLKGTEPMGLFVIPAERTRLFQPGPKGANLDEAFYDYYQDGP